MNTENLVKALKDAAPTILTVCAAAGVVVSNILTAKTALKVDDILRNEEFDRKTEFQPPLTTKEKIKIAAPHYIPSIIVGGATIACMLGSNAMNRKQIAAFAGALALSDNIRERYRNAVIEEYGEEKDTEIMESIQQRTITEEDGKYESTDGMIFFVDGITDEGFYTTKDVVNQAIFKLNRKLHLGNYVTLNSFRRDLGLKPTNFGSVVGWSLLDSCGKNKEDDWVDFHLVPCEGNDNTIYISYLNLPHGLGLDPVEEKRYLKEFKDKEYQAMFI